MTDDITVGVLSTHNSKETKAILNAVDDLGYETEWLRDENTVVDIEHGEISFEPDVDIIANRLLLSNVEQPAERLGLAMTFEKLRPMLNTPMATMTAMHKFAAASALSANGISVPDALLALSSDNLNAGRNRFGEEAVYKTAIGTHGGGTWRVNLDDPVNPKVGTRQAFLQELIERDGERHRDLRVYVVGDKIVGAMNRYAPEDDWRTNVALGGDVEDASQRLPDEVREMALKSKEIIGLDYAGVDIVEGEDGWYVLEVNPTAGFKGLYEATGRSAAPYIAQLAIEAAGGEVDGERVRELSATLDDSVPACKPRRAQKAPSEPIIVGYTEEVHVSGTRGSRTILAKSDTGAKRTSIDAQLAAEIGTGPIKNIVRVKSGSLKSGRSRPVVDLVVGIGGTQHTVTASIEDRSHMDYQLLLGRDILKHYHVDVRRLAEEDFSEDEEEEQDIEE
ncbi:MULTISPECIES: RimK family alpha-L-glutamate ligase [unclassified Haladaptatus]|uniref:RimK family alpha-L-glutamate ligase n=1 Tax=unclassified Haladaptatus TaxID=2622732 RepID=UPI0023E81125|nr:MULTISPECIES: RimK family alpha-L-glutamate ligase [unclassified Haladaptatus]